MSRTPATVVTGFLGAGKTTLLRHLLAHADGARLALVINEFGDVGVDKGIVEGCGIESCTPEGVIELANGCICCTVADDFLPAMKTLLDRPDPFDHIVIETSGLALPKPLVQAFRWPEVRARATVSGVVAVIDSPAVAAGRFARDPVNQPHGAPAHDFPLEEVFEDQLRVADMAILNKADLVDAATLARVRSRVEASLPPGAKAVSAARGALPLEVLLGIGAAAEDAIVARPSLHDGAQSHDHDDFESFTVAFAALSDAAALEARVRAAVAEAGVLRIKGFAEVSGRPHRLVIQAAGPRVESYFDRPWGPAEERLGRLVVVGLKGLSRARIERVLRG
ncbi:MAG: cobalamin biosynthesis protein CobW [Rhodospirillales bacterium RIFCSPLOWO2_12_FULL_67_15]|nr:MAG: cobalamin biosynthesis protein CobW [Rhodospirillales bacterium RIFCSPLOWO2_12_FULL_67_15]